MTNTDLIEQKMTQEDKDLAVFEAWVVCETGFRSFERCGKEWPSCMEGFYKSAEVQIMRKAWQAAREHYAPKWQLIETAPQDGRHIQLYRPEIQFVGYWTKHGWVANAPELPFLDGLTHWRPLSEKPNTTEGSDNA